MIKFFIFFKRIHNRKNKHARLRKNVRKALFDLRETFLRLIIGCNHATCYRFQVIAMSGKEFLLILIVLKNVRFFK
jgi:hypothetical protein